MSGSDGDPAPSTGVAPADQASDSDATSDGTASEEGHDSLLAALEVGSHARVGLAVGLGLAAFLYVPRFPVLDASIEGGQGYYLGLAFVLAATTAALVTAALSIKTFLEPVLDRAAWLRRGGVLAMLGGLGWASTPILAAQAEAGTIDVLLWRNVASLATLALLFGTIGLHCAVKPGARALDGWPRRIERGAYWAILVGLLIAAANATGDAAPVTTVDGEVIATPFLVGALLATVAAIPFAAAAELTGRLPRWRLRALQAGGLLSTLGIAWLVTVGGWDWLVESGFSALPVALAVALLPAGLGWAIAGQGSWARALHDRSDDGAAGAEEQVSVADDSGTEEQAAPSRERGE